MQTQANTCTNAGGLFYSGTSGFINFWLPFFDSRGETQFLKVFRNHTMLTIPTNVRHISWCFRSQFNLAGRDPKKLTTAATVENSTQRQRTQFSAPMAETQLFAWSNLKFSTAWSDLNFSTPWSDPNFSTLWSDFNFSTPWSNPNFSTSRSGLN